MNAIVKKCRPLLAGLLAGCFLFAAACQPTGNESSEESTSSLPTESSTPGIDPAKLRADIDALYSTNKPDRSKAKTNLATGKSYTSSYAADSDYPDPSGNKLTDGKLATATFSSGDKTSWAGFRNRGQLSFELDLSQNYDGIAEIGLRFCKDTSSGIGLPGSVEIYLADTDGEYQMLGVVNTPMGGAASYIHVGSLVLQNTVSAAKIKFVIKNIASTWLFIDEMVVYRYDEAEPVASDYYGSFDVPEVKEPVLWDSTESDYNANINLIAGLPQQIRAGLDLEPAQRVPSQNTEETGKQLTDGIRSSSPDYSSPAWFHFTRGDDRQVVYDLGKTSAVKSYSFGFLKDQSTGISPPGLVVLYASEDGIEWEAVAEIKGIPINQDKELITVQGTLKTPVKARFVKIFFTITSHVWADEFAVFGTKNIAGARAVVPGEADPIAYPNKYLSPEDIGGTHDVLLSYFEPGNDRSTKEVYLPHVAYIENGVVKDTMFDSYLYLPVVRFLYDGSNKKSLTKADWQSYIDSQFADGINLHALDQAVSEVKTALNKPDYKVSVFFSVFFPVKSVTDFGEVNGKNLNFSNLADRKVALKWMIDEQVKVFKSKDYKNIWLQGFYWFTEEIEGDPETGELVKYVTDYVRKLNYISSWIPYFSASGVRNWKDYGFDLVCYQPNYAFNHSIPLQRLYDAAETAKKLGMCIEIEVGTATAADIARLKAYYYVGAQTGYMTDAAHMYYQGGFPGVLYAAYNSKDAFINSVYKDTYEFIKGTFNPVIENPADMTVTGTGKITGKLDVSTDNINIIQLLVGESPKYGSVRLNSNGQFDYTPYGGETVDDHFTIVLDYGYTVSKPITITVKAG